MASACSVEAVAELLLEAPLHDADVALAGAVGYRAVLLNLLEDGRRRLRLALVKGVPGALLQGRQPYGTGSERDDEQTGDQRPAPDGGLPGVGDLPASNTLARKASRVWTNPAGLSSTR